MKAAKFFCYLCGKVVTGRFALASPREKTDRAFICCSKCERHLDAENYVLHVSAHDAQKIVEKNT